MEQIDKLANFIMSEVEGEPSQNEGAGDTAIRIIKQLEAENKELKERIEFAVDYLPESPNKARAFLSPALSPALKPKEGSG